MRKSTSASRSLSDEVGSSKTKTFASYETAFAISTDCICPMEGDPFRYGDIGPLLGEAIYNSRIGAKFQIINASETIRATVIGAGSYSTTVSGSTITQTEKALPLSAVPTILFVPRTR